MPTNKRHKKDIALARVVRDHLEELRREKGLNYTEFANVAGVGRTSVNAWRNSGSIPRGDFLRDLADRFGVTTDWLLGIKGAPKYAGQVRERPELEADLAAHFAREIATRFALDVGDVTVDGKYLLKAAVRAGMRRARKDAARSLRLMLAPPLAWLVKRSPMERERQRVFGFLALMGIQPPTKLQGKRLLVLLRQAGEEASRRRAEEMPEALEPEPEVLSEQHAPRALPPAPGS